MPGSKTNLSRPDLTVSNQPWVTPIEIDARRFAKVVAANRFPVNPATGEFSLGGLATALGSDSGVRWIGASDVSMIEPAQVDGVRCIPATIDPITYVAHYEGAANGVFWPAFHGLAPKRMIPEWWQSYMAVNVSFANAIGAELRTIDSRSDFEYDAAPIWIQDYHLMMLPLMLRQRALRQPIGFFLHIPFPELGEVSDLIESRAVSEDQFKAIVRGLLGADMIGFHINSYSQNFLRLLNYLDLPEVEIANTGASHDHKHEVLVGGRKVRIGSFPIGIEPTRYSEAVAQLADRTSFDKLRARYLRKANHKLMVGVDRLDYTKGIDHRLLAFQKLLRDGVLDARTITLVQVATPNRENIAAYVDHRESVNAIVAEIQNEFGEGVLHYVDQAVPLDLEAKRREEKGIARTFEQIEWPFSDMSVVELLAAADICLVTPVKDGMNLVAKEFVAVQHFALSSGFRSGVGSMVLSDGAGAFEELGEWCHTHKAGSIDDLASAIAEACREAGSKRHFKRLGDMRELAKIVVNQNTVTAWRNSFWRALLHP